MAIITYILIITLNVNEPNAPTKNHRLPKQTQKQDPYTRCLHETPFRSRDIHRLKMRGWKEVIHTNGNHKKAAVAIHILEKKQRLL